MERKESKNGLELIKFGAIRLKGNFSALFMGAFAMVTPLVLVFLVPYLISRFTDEAWIMSIGVALFALLVGPLQMGYIKYFNETIDGKQPKLTRVYSQLNFSVFTLRTTYISVLLIVLYLVGGILWIVPAGFAISFFSMTLFFLEKYKYNRLSEAMTDCARQMIGNRLAMFSYKLIFYFVYALLLGIGALCIGLMFELAGMSMIVSYIVTLCSVIIFIFMYSMVTVYFHSCNQIFFEDTLMYNERKRARLQKTTVASTNNIADNSVNNGEKEKTESRPEKKEISGTDKKEETKSEEKDKVKSEDNAKADKKPNSKSKTKAETKHKPDTKTASKGKGADKKNKN